MKKEINKLLKDKKFKKLVEEFKKERSVMLSKNQICWDQLMEK